MNWLIFYGSKKLKSTTPVCTDFIFILIYLHYLPYLQCLLRLQNFYESVPFCFSIFSLLLLLNSAILFFFVLTFPLNFAPINYLKLPLRDTVRLIYLKVLDWSSLPFCHTSPSLLVSNIVDFYILP